MKGDFTRRTFRPDKQYSSVRMQQGRAQLDADWNEQVEIQQHLSRTQARDVIGQSGVPADAPDGFKIEVLSEGGGTSSITIGTGRMYVDGILCRLAQTLDHLRREDAILNKIRYSQQPSFPTDPADERRLLDGLSSGGAILAYLEVWERHVTSLEDPDIVEVALGGPDTGTRTQTVCQIKLRSFESVEQARELRFSSEDPRPLIVKTEVGGAAPGNQLYRVEIHDPPTATPPKSGTFKWSRDNGSIAAEWVSGDNSISNPITLRGRARFAEGKYVELLDETAELTGRPGEIRRIRSIGLLPGAQTLELEGGPVIRVFGGGRKARLWDSGATPFELSSSSKDIKYHELEGAGISVAFDAGGPAYETGTAWVFPGRDRNIQTTLDITTPDGPLRLVAAAEEPHHFAMLAILSKAGDKVEVVDLRRKFEPIQSLVPRGVIVMWSGTERDIPGGWALCDGSEGTPDLRSRFIMGADPGADDRTPGKSGEPDGHTHAVDLPVFKVDTTPIDDHMHTVDFRLGQMPGLQPGTQGVPNVVSARSPSGPGGAHFHSVTIDHPPATSGRSVPVGGERDENRPRWFALCFIMKL